MSSENKGIDPAERISEGTPLSGEMQGVGIDGGHFAEAECGEVEVKPLTAENLREAPLAPARVSETVSAVDIPAVTATKPAPSIDEPAANAETEASQSSPYYHSAEYARRMEQQGSAQQSYYQPDYVQRYRDYQAARAKQAQENTQNNQYAQQSSQNQQPYYNQYEYYPPARPPKLKSMYRNAGSLFLKVILAVYGFSVVLTIFRDIFFPSGAPALASDALNGIFVTMLGIMLPFLLFIFANPKQHRSQYNLRRAGALQIITAILVGVGLFFVATAVNAACITLCEGIGLDFSALASDPVDLTVPLNFITSVVLVCVMPAIAEELLFRGVFMYAWRSLGRMRVSLLVGFMFAIMHGSIPSLPALFLVGLVLCLVAYDSRSVFPCIALHFTYNFMCVLYDLAVQLAERSAGAATDAEGGSIWVVIAVMCAVGLIVAVPSMLIFKHVSKKRDAKRPEELVKHVPASAQYQGVTVTEQFPFVPVLIGLVILLFSALISFSVLIPVQSVEGILSWLG